MKKPTLSIFSKSLLLILGFSATASAVTVFSAGDTFYNRQDKDTNYGASDTVLVKFAGTGINLNRVGMFRFDIGVLTSTVASASLSLFVTDVDNGDSYTIYGIKDLNFDDKFNESTLTFNTSQSGGGVADFGGERNVNLNSVTALGTLSLSASDQGTMVTFPNGAALRAFIDADTNGTVSFAIQTNNTGTDVDQFRSKEGAATAMAPLTAPTAPTLNYTLVPEPSAVLLFTITSGGLLLRRNRRA